jgi:hypothetical protein
MKLTIRSAVAVLGVMSVVSCATVVPTYQETVDNVTKLEQGGNSKVSLGEFKADPALQSLHSRANTFNSPYHDSFSEYLREALRLELARAGRYYPHSDIRVDAELQRNNLDISGINVGSQEITARFIVLRRGKIAYDRVKSIRKQWDSSLYAAIAVPLARDAYPEAVHMLLSELFSDPEFIAAIK